MTVFQIIKTLFTFGPDVVTLIGELINDIQKQDAGKDRHKAERIMYIKAWRTYHGVPDMPETNGK